MSQRLKRFWVRGDGVYAFMNFLLAAEWCELGSGQDNVACSLTTSMKQRRSLIALISAITASLFLATLLRLQLTSFRAAPILRGHRFLAKIFHLQEMELVCLVDAQKLTGRFGSLYKLLLKKAVHREQLFLKMFTVRSLLIKAATWPLFVGRLRGYRFAPMVLETLGWRSVIVWECEISNKEELAAKLAAFLGPVRKRQR